MSKVAMIYASDDIGTMTLSPLLDHIILKWEPTTLCGLPEGGPFRSNTSREGESSSAKTLYDGSAPV